MKKLFFTLFTFTSLLLATTSCDKDSTGSSSEQTLLTADLGNGSTAYELTEDLTLNANTTYNLKGFVYVPQGRTITIEAGTVIKGDKDTKGTLIIERGGRIVAKGTKEAPIVFTSAKAAGSRSAGDWGGIIILGYAENNNGVRTMEGGIRSSYGGSSNSDSSGTLSYVRIEFAGIEYSVDNEINGLTLGSVGSGTIIDHIQVSYSGDDSFEWFGGSVNCYNLVSLSAFDDDFDTDYGYNGTVQFGVALRNPEIADKSASNGFESDNDSLSPTSQPRTSATFANFSLFGPVSDKNNYTDQGSVAGSSSGFFQTGAQIRRGSYLNIYNTLIAGYPIGMIIENDKGGDSLTAKLNGTGGEVSGVVVAGAIKNFQDYATNSADDIYSSAGEQISSELVESYFTQNELSNLTVESIEDLKLSGDPFSLTDPVMIPSSDSEYTKYAISSSNIMYTGYVGAFSASETVDNNWMSGWTNFDPQNTVY
ncbi:MAG: hypothetical protein R3Y50_03360 [Rikenellaceae bacterium]